MLIDVLIYILLFVLLLTLSAFFSGSETAYFSLTPAQLEKFKHSAVKSEKKVAKLGWMIEFGTKKIVFTGDAEPQIQNLPVLVRNTDILVMHHAIPESGVTSEKSKFLSPSAIGTVAYKSRAKQLILGHRRAATLGKEKETIAAINSKYAGLVQFANDLDCFSF